MAIALFKERRFKDRKIVTGLLPGKLVFKLEALSARVLDLSPQGMGVLVPKEIPVGALLTLTMLNQEIPFCVQWVQKDFGKQDMFRYGLMCSDQSVNLESLFEKTGCVK